jgi:hypothetical protein
LPFLNSGDSGDSGNSGNFNYPITNLPNYQIRHEVHMPESNNFQNGNNAQAGDAQNGDFVSRNYLRFNPALATGQQFEPTNSTAQPAASGKAPMYRSPTAQRIAAFGKDLGSTALGPATPAGSAASSVPKAAAGGTRAYRAMRSPYSLADESVQQYSTPTAYRNAQGKTLPQYRMGIGHRILGTLANFANGFAGNHAAPIYVGPGALNQRYYQDEQARQQNLANALRQREELYRREAANRLDKSLGGTKLPTASDNANNPNGADDDGSSTVTSDHPVLDPRNQFVP